MKQKIWFFITSCVLLLQVACTETETIYEVDQTTYAYTLGKQLFFDTRLSVDGSVSCASCHHPEKAFTDGKRLSEGVHGRKTMRNAPSLLNLKGQPHFMWDGGVSTLAMQALVPIQDTNEMGSNVKELVTRLSKDEVYADLALKAFDRPFDAYVLTQSLAVFQEQLISRNSPFDQWYYEGDTTVVSADVKAGFNLFSERLACVSCHQLPDFTSPTFANKGLEIVNNDTGRHRITRDSSDIGKFKIPSLRNSILTAPYMHDGSIATLEDAIRFAVEGGGTHWNKDQRIQPQVLTEKEYRQLYLFLESLTDTSYLINFR